MVESEARCAKNGGEAGASAEASIGQEKFGDEKRDGNGAVDEGKCTETGTIASKRGGDLRLGDQLEVNTGADCLDRSTGEGSGAFDSEDAIWEVTGEHLPEFDCIEAMRWVAMVIVGAAMCATAGIALACVLWPQDD